MRSRGMWGWCLVCCGKIQYKGKYNWKFICNILSILMEGDRRTGNLPPGRGAPERATSYVALARREHLCRAGKFPVRRSSSRIMKYEEIHIYCAASGATYEYALDIFAALFVRVTASL